MLNRRLDMDQVSILNAKARRSSLALCTATDKSYPLADRLDAVKSALSQWTIGGFEYNNVLRQVPDLAHLIVVEVA